MAHFAQLDSANRVIQVVVIGNQNCLDDGGIESEQVGIDFCHNTFGVDTNWIQTSYNSNIRKNYAGIGFTYDAQRDAFIPPSPYPSWILNEGTCQWDPPVPMPPSTETTVYVWNEELVQWDAVDVSVEEN